MMTFNKLAKLELYTFKNSLRLHNDAILLYNNSSYSSASFLSILSLEELGKFFIISDIIFYDLTSGMRSPDKNSADQIKLIYAHRHKQQAFYRNSPYTEFALIKGLKRVVRELKKLEIVKQNSVYVGLGKKNGKVDVNGKIKHPFKIKRVTVEAQITKVNDEFTDLCMGNIYKYREVENEGVVKLLNKSLLKKLRRNWRKESITAKKRIKEIKRQFLLKYGIEVV